MSPAPKKPKSKAKDLLAEIRGRRETSAGQALALLDLAAASDREAKFPLLSTAARSLHDPKVAGRWIELAGGESDTELLEGMIGTAANALDPRGIPDLNAWVRLLAAALGADATRNVALSALSRLLPAHKDAARLLVEAYESERSAPRQRAILRALCTFDDPPEPVARLLESAMSSIDADQKPGVVSRLLFRDRLGAKALTALLDPTEPPALRRLVLSHAIDRGLELDAAMAAVLAKDPDAECRRLAAEALAARGSDSPAARKALLAALQGDAHEGVRTAAALAFAHSLEAAAPARAALVEALAEARTRESADLILRLLTPYLSRDAAIRAGLVGLLRRNLKADLAVHVHALLGLLAAWDEKLLSDLRKAFEGEGDDRVRVAILKTLSAVPEADASFVKLYHQALKAPDKQIKTWAAAGLLHLPLTEANVPALLPAARALTDRDIDSDVRLHLAQKIARIPAKSAEFLDALRTAAKHATYPELAKLCERAVEEAPTPDGGPKPIDWDDWLRRVDVEGRSEGIFPEIYDRYDENPEMARRILKAAMKPGVNLYNVYGYDVSALSILSFFVARNAVDDDLARFAVSWALEKDSGYGSPDAPLSALFSLPKPATLKDPLWKIFEKRRDVNPILMRELLVRAHGGDTETAAAFRKRLAAKETANAVLPYVLFLLENLAWREAEGLLVAALERFPFLEDPDLTRRLDEAFKLLGRARPSKAPQPPGPGFADE